MAGPAINTGSLVVCPMGMVPIGVFTALPTAMVMISGTIAGKITDCAPFADVSAFGTCGVYLYLVPCVPAITPWLPTSTVLIGGVPNVTSASMAFCMTGLGIPVKVVPTQVTVMS